MPQTATFQSSTLFAAERQGALDTMMNRRLAALLILALIATSHERAIAQSTQNGIYVGHPKVYDDQALQRLLNSLRARLAQLNGLDQASLTTRLGSLQGASAQQTQFSIQATPVPIPGVTTTNSSGTPGLVQTGSSGTSQAPTGLTTTTNNQLVTSTPGTTTLSQTTAPQVSATIPNLPSVAPVSLPSTFSTSASDTLSEQVQLSYEIINLQLLLQGALDDEFIAGTTFRKHHSTIGFPISIFTPKGGDYRNAVAEVEISVCDPEHVVNQSESPSLMNILPKEKTYNIASIVNKSAALGVGAVIGGIINVGGNFLWGRQTYYVVQAQDTVAAIRPPAANVCRVSTPVTFAWQFRPVLGQKTVHQGLRQTFAQVALPSLVSSVLNESSSIKITTRWLAYEPKTGIVGAQIGSTEEESDTLAVFPPGPTVNGVQVTINGDGTLGVESDGHFLAGTRVRIGDTFLDDSTPGFQNDGIDTLRFTAVGASLAQRGARVAASNGFEADILAPGQGNGSISEGGEIAPEIYSDSLVEVTVPVVPGPALPPGGPYPIVVNLGTRTFGLPDAPFSRIDSGSVSFLVPREFIRTQNKLLVKRLFLGSNYACSHSIKQSSGLSVTSVTILGVTKGIAKGATNRGRTGTNDANAHANAEGTKKSPDITHFAIVGSKLKSAGFLFPPAAAKLSLADETYNAFDLSAEDLDGVKQFVLQVQDKREAPIFVSVPESKAADAKPHLDPHDPIPPGTALAYTITGSLLDSVVSIRYLDKPLPFSLSLDKKSVTLVLPNDLSNTAGIKRLYLIFSDGSSQSYQVTINASKTR